MTSEAAAGRAPRRRRAVVLLLVLALLGGIAFGAWRLIQSFGSNLLLWQSCTAKTDEGSYTLATDRAANAATIAAVGVRRGASEQAITVALATAMQESKLRNLDHGDRDSLGLFQQRPSQGWGTPAQVRDPVYAATKFYEGLKKVRGWEDMSLTDAAQAVQRSGYGHLYAQHEEEARILAAVLTGRERQGLACSVRGVDRLGEEEGRSGLTPRAARVREKLEDAFGEQSLGGFAPGGVRTGHMAGSAHYDGRALDIFFRPINEANKRDGWAVAHWLVAHADELGIATVIYDDAIWTARRSPQGWRPYRVGGSSAAEDEAPAGANRDAVRRHLDHVHVDVTG